MPNLRQPSRRWLSIVGALFLAGLVAAVGAPSDNANPAPPPAPPAALPPAAPASPASGLTPMDDGQIVYDANQQVYWLANANLAADAPLRARLGVAGINPNGTMTYTTANQWVTALNRSDYLNIHTWQLPDTPLVDHTCAELAGAQDGSFGPLCTGSALGNLYAVGLNRNYPNSVVPRFTDTIGLFRNLQPSLYWTSEAFAGDTGDKTYSFNTDLTGENTTKYNYFYTLPMVTGTLGAPGAGSGLVPYVSGPAAGKAVYDTVSNMTWLLDADLAATDGFTLTGHTTTITISDGGVLTVPLINTSGAMLFATANLWLADLNANHYAGTRAWTLPALADLNTLFAHLHTQPGVALAVGDPRLTAPGDVGPFQNLQPFFYWACERDSPGTSQSPCNGQAPGGLPWSFVLDSGFQATDFDTKAFYVAVYSPVPPSPPVLVWLPLVRR